MAVFKVGQWWPEPRHSREGPSRGDISKTEPARFGTRSDTRVRKTRVWKEMKVIEAVVRSS